MRSKKFRNQHFYIGDLVEPNWNPKQPIGLGVVLDVQVNRWDEKCITVCWQLTAITKESPIDLNLLEQVID